ncbi:hypothetical protein ACFQ58_03250 [Agromyces sp. NPDC056523]|uniref:hypothetical protein n=1 Tax=Agromyces sp. NPDC056523 TaxID=3345850 RepID=UPI00366ADA2C
MNTKKAAPVIFTVSLAVLVGGGAGTAAWGGPGPVRDDGGATVVGFAHGHVIVKDDLSPIRGSADILSTATDRTPQSVTRFSAEALREMHAQAPVGPTVQGLSAEGVREFHAQGPAPYTVPGFGSDAIREMHAGAPAPKTANGLTADALREFHATAQQSVAPQSARELSADARRELHSGSVAPRTTAAEAQGQRLAEYAEAVARSTAPSAAEMQGERLSAYADAVADATPPTEWVDDDLSPIAGAR